MERPEEGGKRLARFLPMIVRLSFFLYLAMDHFACNISGDALHHGRPVLSLSYSKLMRRNFNRKSSEQTFYQYHCLPMFQFEVPPEYRDRGAIAIGAGHFFFGKSTSLDICFVQ